MDIGELELGMPPLSLGWPLEQLLLDGYAAHWRRFEAAASAYQRDVTALCDIARKLFAHELSAQAPKPPPKPPRQNVAALYAAYRALDAAALTHTWLDSAGDYARGRKSLAALTPQLSAELRRDISDLLGECAAFKALLATEIAQERTKQTELVEILTPFVREWQRVNEASAQLVVSRASLQAQLARKSLDKRVKIVDQMRGSFYFEPSKVRPAPPMQSGLDKGNELTTTTKNTRFVN